MSTEIPEDVLNDTFKKLYQPLNQNEIRVLYLLPGQADEQVALTLKTVSLGGIRSTDGHGTGEEEGGKYPDDDPSFIALSYVWGDPTIRRIILVNGHELPVTTNLEAALRSFRNRGIPQVEFDEGWKPFENDGHEENDDGDDEGSEPRWWDGVRWNAVVAGEDTMMKNMTPIWADAICINQRDIPERNQQVSLMAHIYLTAKLVVSWLGGDDPKITTPVLEMVHKAARDISLIMDAFRHWGGIERLHHEDESEAHQWMYNLFSWMEKFPFMCRGDLGSGWSSNAHWLALSRFSGIRYAGRIWIVQEICLARSLVLCDGVEHCRISDMTGVIEWAETIDDMCREVLGGRSLGPTGGPPKIPAEFWTSRHTFAEWLSDSPTFDILEFRNSDSRDVATWEDASYLMLSGKATDPRDFVYGLTGLIPNCDIQPDYTKSKQEVFADWFQTVLRQDPESAFDAMAHSGLGIRPVGDVDWPSWLPDLSNMNRGLVGGLIIKISTFRSWGPSWQLPRVQSNNVLVVHGALVAEVTGKWDARRLLTEEFKTPIVLTKMLTLWFCFINAYLDELRSGSLFHAFLRVLLHSVDSAIRNDLFWEAMRRNILPEILHATIDALDFPDEQQLWQYYKRVLPGNNPKGGAKTNAAHIHRSDEHAESVNRFFTRLCLRDAQDISQWYLDRLPDSAQSADEDQLADSTTSRPDDAELNFVTDIDVEPLFAKTIHSGLPVLGGSYCDARPGDKVFAVAGVSSLLLMREVTTTASPASQGGGQQRWVQVASCYFPDIDEEWLGREAKAGRLEPVRMEIV